MPFAFDVYAFSSTSWLLLLVLQIVAISDGLAILIAMTLYFMDRKHGAPWLVASVFMATQAIVTCFAPSIPLLNTLFQLYASLSPEFMLLIGLGSAILVGYFGRQHGRGTTKSPPQTSPV